MRPSSTLLLMATCACTGSDKAGGDTSGDSSTVEVDSCLSSPMEIELGTGEFEFEPLDSSGSIEVIHGTQDGHHILGSVRIQNITDVATIHYTITTIGTGERISDQVYRLRLSSDPDGKACAMQAIGMYGYLGRIDPGTADFLMEPNLLEMTVTSTAGDAVSASTEVYPFLIAVEHGTDTGEPIGE